MKKSSIWKLLFSALTVFAVAVFAGCTDDNDDMGAPYLNVTPENLTFDAEGQPADEYNGTFIVETNRPWRAIVEDEQTWVRLSATEGEGDAAVTVTVPASNIGQSAKVTFEVYNSYGALIQKDVNVLQGEVVPPTLIFNETAGSESVANPYPLVADYTGWNTTGEGASKVSYEGVNTSIRASGKSSAGAYDGASGPNVIFFGSAPATFTVKDITLASDQTNLKLTFGGQYYDGDNNDNNFNKDNFVVYLSANGTDYTPLSYEVNDGDQVDPYWVFATKNFTLKNATSTLYIKFEAKASSKFRLDDITLMTGNGGEEIDLAGGGVVPPDPSGDAIYENNFDKTPAEKVDNKWPFLDQTDAWQNASGTGNSTVTYTSANVSVRTSGKLSGGYDGASGSNKIFFGSAKSAFCISFSVTIARNSCRFLENLSSVLTLCCNDRINLALTNHRISVTAKTCIHKQFMNILQANYGIIYKIFTCARTIISSCNGNLVFVKIKSSVAVVDSKSYLCKACSFTILCTVKYDIFHL